MKRPTFFISSTIYDFRDLRSAIKYYLEQQGCKVLASEFNDFEKPLDGNSYDACLNSIHLADYFILLIGSRVGGWYDEPNRISITQREYREAYSCHLSDGMKIITFVRAEVWQAKDDRNDLVRYLRSVPIDEASKLAIANHPSKTVSDAEFISQFLREVGRVDEMKMAVQGLANSPSANWIHVMSGFRDVVDVLHRQAFSFVSHDDATARRLLRRELQEMAKTCLVKAGDVTMSPRRHIEAFCAALEITAAKREFRELAVDVSHWDMISSLSVHLMGVDLQPVILPQLLFHPTFLEFDREHDSYKETPAYEAAVRLLKEVRRLREVNNSETMSIVHEYSPRARGSSSRTLFVDTFRLLGFLYLLDRWVNVIELSVSLLKYLDGEPFQMPDLRSESPIPGFQKHLDEERVSDADLSVFLKSK